MGTKAAQTKSSSKAHLINKARQRPSPDAYDFFIRISSSIFEKILLPHTPKFRGDYPLTDDGIEELTDMIRAARITTKTWHEFLDDFVEDIKLVARIKAKSLR